MAINVNYAPDINLLGQAAFGVGQGQFLQQQAARQDANALNWAQLAQQANLAQAHLQAQQQSQLFGHAADMQRMAFGAGLENQQRQLQYDQQGEMLGAQQDFAWQQAQAQQKFQEEQQKRAAEYHKQQMLDRMSETGKQKKAQMDREWEAIQSADLMPHQKQMAEQQWHARHGDFDAAIYALDDTMIPGKTVSIGGFDHLIGGDGTPKKLGPTYVAPAEWFKKYTNLPVGSDGMPVDPVTKQPLGFTWNVARGGYELVKPQKDRLPPETWASFYRVAKDIAEAAAGPDGKADEVAIHRHAKRMAQEYESYVHGTPIPPEASASATPAQPSLANFDWANPIGSLMPQPAPSAPTAPVAPQEPVAPQIKAGPPPILPDGPQGDAIFNALPSGATFFDPQGNLRRKP